MSFEIAAYILTLVSGIILSIEDLKHKRVSISQLLIFLFCSLLCFIFSENREFCFWPFVIFLLIGATYFFIKRKQAFGLADYIIAIAVGFILPENQWPMFLVYTGIFGALIGIVRKERKLPFIPAIILSLVVIALLR